MATAATLIDSTPTTHFTIKGVLIEGMAIEPRDLQIKTHKFWGVIGESQINGRIGGRNLQVPIIIYDSSDFDTARKLSNYIDYDLNTTAAGKNGTLTLTSESNHSPFADCTFLGAAIMEGPKKDFAGTLGGGYFAACMLLFRQLAAGSGA